jgi:hypothetical protein
MKNSIDLLNNDLTKILKEVLDKIENIVAKIV